MVAHHSPSRRVSTGSWQGMHSFHHSWVTGSAATQHWWDLVMPLMQPLADRADGEFWSDMTEVYHLD